MAFSLHYVAVALLTTAAGAALIRMGIGTGLLRAKVESRRCASCSRRFDGWHCPNCERR
jgi:hypothetical protein